MLERLKVLGLKPSYFKSLLRLRDPHRANARAYIKIGGFKEEYSYEVTREFERSAQRAAGGDLTSIEETLVSQMHLLSIMFISMSKKMPRQFITKRHRLMAVTNVIYKLEKI